MDIHGIVDLQRRYFESGVTLDLQGRLDALDRLREVILKHEDEINAALYADLGKSATESYICEIGMTLSELSYIRNHLSRWTRDHSVRTPMSQFHAKSFTVQEPYGIVLIMSPWNYPFMLCMDPLIGAIAAGNCCVLKPSAYSPATSAIIRKIIAETYEEQYVTVVEGGRAENTALLEQHFDYIFFTGGVAVGRQVLEKAARYLTPVTLELGGKSPCIVDKTADLPLAARRIAFGKYLNLGQTCVAPDYLLIDRSIKDQFLGMLKKEIALQYGEKPLENPNYGKIINQKHFDRLMHLMDPAKIVIGGESDPEKLRIAPTVMDRVTAEDAVMGEEIFGPILPILTYDSIQEAEQFIRSRPHPLALYLFTTDEKTEQRFLHHVPFGGGCINDTIIHLATSAMPFGGVGQSGMGGYHGKKSFETFSHQKSIVKKSNWIDMKVRYQPYTNQKKRMLRLFLK